MDDGSPLKQRSFRDHFEHFDERLDTWAGSSEGLVYADSNVGTTPGKGVIFGFEDGEYLRNIYRTRRPSEFAIAFRGEDFYLPPVMEAVRDLAERAEAKSRDLPGRGRI